METTTLTNTGDQNNGSKGSAGDTAFAATSET